MKATGSLNTAFVLIEQRKENFGLFNQNEDHPSKKIRQLSCREGDFAVHSERIHGNI